MPAQQEQPSDPHGGQGGEQDQNNYVGHNPHYGQPAAGHAPQQQPASPQDQNPYGNQQGYQAAPYQDPNQPAAPTYPTQPQAGATYDPAHTATPSWADVNQPVPQTAAHGQGYGDQASYAAPQPQAPAYSEAPPAYDPTLAQQQAQAHYQQTAPPVQPTTPTAAPSGYDFGGYEAPHQTPQLDPGFQAQQEPAVDWGNVNFAPVAGAAVASQSAEFGYPAQNPNPNPNLNPGQNPGMHAGGFDVAQQPVLEDEGYAGEEDYEYEDEEPSGRGRSFIVAAALAGAIVIGGGVAYGYQSIFGTPSTGQPPVVKGATGPAKVKPADPGGRKFAHTKSKIMGRLGSASGKTNDPSGGARRVSTLRIGRDGSVLAPSNPAAGASGNRMVSGLTLGGTPVATKGAQAKAVKKPIVVKPPPVKVAAVKPAPVKVVKPKPAPVKKIKPVVKTKPVAAPKKVAVAKPAPVAAVGPKPTGAGYVAVLASVPVSKSSRMDSLKQFADMQQKYGTVLSNKTPDVQQANLGAKGTYHRLIAGPPGSAQSARQVCTSLKAAGYPSCWVLAY